LSEAVRSRNSPAELLYEDVIEVEERLDAEGNVVRLKGNNEAPMAPGDISVTNTPGGGFGAANAN